MEKLANLDSFAMGIQSLSTAIGVSKKMFETYIQPGLFYNDFIDISTKGRRLKYKGLIKYSEEKNIDLISEDEYKNSTI
jgi:Holliday junction resolvasome RuvABC ATP-dependent DNA helicase subunit